MCVLVCQWWRLAVRTVSALWCFEAAGSWGGSGLGDRVVFWFDFGQGVNKSGEEALVTYRPADNISGSGDLCCQAKLFLRHTHTLMLTHIRTALWQICFCIYIHTQSCRDDRIAFFQTSYKVLHRGTRKSLH